MSFWACKCPIYNQINVHCHHTICPWPITVMTSQWHLYVSFQHSSDEGLVVLMCVCLGIWYLVLYVHVFYCQIALYIYKCLSIYTELQKWCSTNHKCYIDHNKTHHVMLTYRIVSRFLQVTVSMLPTYWLWTCVVYEYRSSWSCNFRRKLCNYIKF